MSYGRASKPSLRESRRVILSLLQHGLTSETMNDAWGIVQRIESEEIARENTQDAKPGNET